MGDRSVSRVVVNEIEAKVGNDISFNDTVKIDTLKGKTAAGSVTVQGEGTNTTNLQQGLTKVWCHWVNDTSQATNGIYDSLNVSGLTDVGSGASRFAYTTNMGQAVYSVPTGGMHDGGTYIVDVYLDHDTPPTTSQIDLDILQESSNASGIGARQDDGLWSMSILGDLA